MLISQHAVHVQALRDLYKRCVRREGFPGSPLQESIQGYPGTHAILDRLGLIKHAEEAVEDPQRVLADLVDFIKSLDSASECALDFVDSSATHGTSKTTISEKLWPEPNTRRESPDSAVLSTSGTWVTATSDETHLCHAYDEYRPMDPQYTALLEADDAGTMRAEEYVELPWNYFPSHVRCMPTGMDTSYSRTEMLDLPPSSTSSSWSEIASQPLTTPMPMVSRTGVSEPLVYMIEQSGLPDVYPFAQLQNFTTGPVQRQHQHQQQCQHQRLSVDNGLLHSSGQYVYL